MSADTYTSIGNSYSGFRYLSPDEARTEDIAQGTKCNVCDRVVRPVRNNGQRPLVEIFSRIGDLRNHHFFHRGCHEPGVEDLAGPEPEVQYVDRYVDRYHDRTTSEHLRMGANGVGRAVRNNPGRSLLALGLTGLAIAAVVGVGMYYSQGMELRCVRDLTEDRVAYCAEMPSGLSASERENYPFKEYIAEDQFFPAPGADVRSYSDLQNSGGDEFTHLEWTNYFSR